MIMWNLIHDSNTVGRAHLRYERSLPLWRTVITEKLTVAMDIQISKDFTLK